jgi:chromosome partitioning protein
MNKSTPLREISSIMQMTPQGAGKITRKLETSMKGNIRHLPPQTVRELFEQRGFAYPKKNILFHCLKGGASKTTLAYNTAYRLSQLGARVLLVDLDKQANATRSFEITQPEKVFVDVVMGKCPLEDTIAPISEFLDLVPSSFKNARIELELINKKQNPQTFYERIFGPVRSKYDVVIFDLPPDLNHNTYLCSIYASTICIPTNPDEYSVMGMRMTLESIQGIQDEYKNLNQEVFIVWSKYDARERNSFHYITELKDVQNATVMPVVVRADATFKNAQSQKQSVFEFSKKSNAREDIDILAQELIGLRDFFAPKANA